MPVPLPVMDPLVSVTVLVVSVKVSRSNVPPEMVSVPPFVKRSLALICNVPALTTVPPLKVLAPPNTIVPTPVLLRAPLPSIALVTV